MNDFLAKLLSMAPQAQATKFSPQDLLVPQTTIAPAVEPQEIIQEDPLANLEDKGYVPPTREQQNSPGFKAAQNVFSGKMNSAPLVGQAPAEALGAYADRKPATLEDLVPSKDTQPPVDVIAPFLQKQSNYQDAIARRDQMLQNADLREGTAGLAAALAGGKSQYSAKNLRERAELETQDVTKGIEAKNLEEINNPGSDISKFAQERANSILKTINPESPLLGKLKGMTAQQLKTVFGDKVLGGAGEKDSRAVAAGNYVDARTGQPLHFDEGMKKWVNGITGKVVDESTIVSRPIAYTDPLTGGRGFYSAQGMVGAGGQLPQKVETPQSEQTLGDFKVSGGITPKDTATIDKDKEGFESSVKDTAKVVDGLTGVDALVDEALKNPNAYSSIGGIVGGLFEPGKLTDEDAKRYIQSSGILNRIRDLDAKYRTGKMDPGLAAEIKGTAKAYREQLEIIIKEKALRKAEATKKGLVGSARKEIPTATIADYYYQPKQSLTGSSEMVKVVSPDGKSGSIPKSNLEKALKKGYKEVQ